MTLHVGLVGGGGITDTHARAVRACPALELVAFFGQNREKTGALAARYGGIAHERFDDFLAHRPMDFVILGSPSGLHAEQGIAAVERGLHVLVEKPIDIATPRADALIVAAERAGVRLGVLFQDRLNPSFLRLQQTIRAGGLGRILLASARVKWYRPPQYYAASRWRGTLALDGGGALINQGIHTLDLLLWLLGPVARVKAATARQLHRIEGEDTALALLELQSGALATLEATTCAFPGYSRRLELTGTEGTLIVEGDAVIAAELRSPAPGLVTRTSEQSAESAASPAVSDASAHARVIADFATAIRSGGFPACDGVEGRRSLALVEAIYAASRGAGTTV